MQNIRNKCCQLVGGDVGFIVTPFGLALNFRGMLPNVDGGWTNVDHQVTCLNPYNYLDDQNQRAKMFARQIPTAGGEDCDHRHILREYFFALDTLYSKKKAIVFDILSRKNADGVLLWSSCDKPDRHRWIVDLLANYQGEIYKLCDERDRQLAILEKVYQLRKHFNSVGEMYRKKRQRAAESIELSQLQQLQQQQKPQQPIVKNQNRIVDTAPTCVRQIPHRKNLGYHQTCCC